MNIIDKKKRLLKMVGIIAALAVTGMLMHYYGEVTKAQERQQAIADQIIRLHVIANSDSEEDQAVKMKVKETVLMYLRGEMKDAVTIGEARQAIRENLPEIETIAEEKLKMEGYDYGVTASLEPCYFPVKQYGDMTFPAGEYEALRVRLGKSKGKNWWCVMYPTLCFVDSVYQVVPDASKEKLQRSLSQEDYDSLLDGGEDITFGSRIAEWIQGVIGS